MVLELLALPEQWQLGIKGLYGTCCFSKLPLGLLLSLLVLLELAEGFCGLGFRLQRAVKLRARPTFASPIGVTKGPALANQLLKLLIKARLDRLGLLLKLLQQALLIDRGRSQAQGINASLSLPHPEVSPTLAQTSEIAATNG